MRYAPALALLCVAMFSSCDALSEPSGKGTLELDISISGGFARCASSAGIELTEGVRDPRFVPLTLSSDKRRVSGEVRVEPGTLLVRTVWADSGDSLYWGDSAVISAASGRRVRYAPVLTSPEYVPCGGGLPPFPDPPPG